MKYKADLNDYIAIGEKIKEMRQLNSEISDLMSGKFPKSLYNVWDIDQKLGSARSKLEGRLMIEQPTGYASLSIDEVFEIFYGEV